MKSNRLQLNSSKTKVHRCVTSRHHHQLPTSALLVDGVTVDHVTSIRDLGIFIDADLVMKAHVQRTVSRCFAVLRQLRQIRQLVPPTALKILVLSRLDYGNGVLTGLPRLSQYRTRRHGWSAVYVAPITSQMRSSTCTGFASQSESSIRLPCWRTRCCMELHRSTWVRLLVWLICQVDVLSVQPVQIAWLCHLKNFLLLAAACSR